MVQETQKCPRLDNHWLAVTNVLDSLLGWIFEIFLGDFQTLWLQCLRWNVCKFFDRAIVCNASFQIVIEKWNGKIHEYWLNTLSEHYKLCSKIKFSEKYKIVNLVFFWVKINDFLRIFKCKNYLKNLNFSAKNRIFYSKSELTKFHDYLILDFWRENSMY